MGVSAIDNIYGFNDDSFTVGEDAPNFNLKADEIVKDFPKES